MKDFKAIANHVFEYVKTVCKWFVIAGVTGLVGGAVGSLFHHGVDYATELRTLCPWLLYLLPLAGVVIAALYHLMHTHGIGTNAVIDAVHQGYHIPIRLIPAIFLGTILTHLCGGSAGREGAALQIGGSLGCYIGRYFKLDEKDMRIATLSGMSAVFSALFGTPLTATFFALEVISVGVIYYSALIPCLTASLIALEISRFFGIAPTCFVIAMEPVEVIMMLKVAGLALLCALISVLFCIVMHRSEHLFSVCIKNSFVRIFVGGVIVVALTLLYGSTDCNGAGMDIIQRALEEGQARPELFAFKLLLTAATIGSGFKGGEVVPTLFIGATFGCTAGALLGLPAPFGAALGIVCLFCSMVNCPIASILLSIELFGADGVLCFALGCAVSYVLSGYRGLYSSQTILYSKLRAEFINVHTK